MRNPNKNGSQESSKLGTVLRCIGATALAAVALTPTLLAPGAIERKYNGRMDLLGQQLQETHDQLSQMGLDPNNLPTDPGLTVVLPSDQHVYVRNSPNQ